MWRRYKDIKRARWERLVALWAEALKALVPEAPPANKKAVKKAKDLEAKYMRVDRDGLLKEHMKAAQRQYYAEIEGYVNSNKAFRRGIKAFIQSKLKKGEAVYLSGAPDFHYMLTVPQAQQLILEAAA